MIAVGPGIGQDVHPVVAHFDRESIGMGVGRDRQEPMWTGIASAPDLFAVGRAQLRIKVEPGIGIMARAAFAGPPSGDGRP